MFFSRSGGLMRSALKGSYSTPKNLASAPPIPGSFTWNSSTSTSSTPLFLRRAALMARSSSPAAITLSITRYSYFDCTVPGICWRTRKAMASVLASSTMPSSCSAEKGCPARLLMSWITPIRSVPDSPPRIGAISICLERYPVRWSTAFRNVRLGEYCLSSARVATRP